MKKIVKIIILFFIMDIIFINYAQDVKCSEIKERRIVYLTFDDGPSFTNTDAILDVLCKNKVKATFCVVGENVINNRQTIKRIDRLNMSIIPHCNTHEYSKIYSSSMSYIDDLEKCEETINSVLNKNKKFKMVRIPGGSTNTICNYAILNQIKNKIVEKEMYYIDWNIDCGDTHSYLVDKNRILENINMYAGKESIEIVLMHDLQNKVTTTNSLQEIIDIYKDMGYEFKTVDEMEEWEINYLINRGVINRKK